MSTSPLAKLAATGNLREIEEKWLAFLEQDSTAEQWRGRAEVLKTLAKGNHRAEGEALATTALESLTGTLEGPDLIAACGSFLVALKDSDCLRATLAGLYREVYADMEGLETLLEEAGVEGGRPARRALRTMEVCLGLDVGGVLAHRHEEDAARVLGIDREAWRITIETGDGKRTLRGVELADNYHPADENDFRVMARFHPDKLREALRNEPGRIVTDIVRANGPTMNSDELRALLCPEFIGQKEWSRWWTKARQALRVSRCIKIEGRLPYFLKYDAAAASFEDEIEAQLNTAHDPLRELELIEEYVRGCKLRKQDVDTDLLLRTREKIKARVRESFARNGKMELAPRLCSHRIAELAGVEDATAYVAEALRHSDDPAGAILKVENQTFWPVACAALEQTHPDNLAEALARLLPHAPIKVANHLAERLVAGGWSRAQFEQIAEEILRDPIGCDEGVLWLWQGPTVEEARVQVPLVTIFTKLIYALGEARRSDGISKEHAKLIQQNVRDILKARKFARFQEMLDQIEPGVAVALRTQLIRLDNIGRVGEDLLRMINHKFPQLTVVAQKLPMWLQDDILYVTSKGYEKKHGEIDHMVNVKMRENAVAIGKAAELGDLSENSEYKFALEERDLLQARLAQMQNEMKIARILEPAEVPDDEVGIGTRVELEHIDTGTRKTITLLSPWEANLDQDIYNYLTPLAQSMLGTKVGKSTMIEFFDPPGEYRVVKVSNALEN